LHPLSPILLNIGQKDQRWTSREKNITIDEIDAKGKRIRKGLENNSQDRTRAAGFRRTSNKGRWGPSQ